MFAILLCTLASSVTAKTLWHELDGYTFEQFETEFTKSYGSAEERNSRAAIFAERLAVVKAHNANPAHSWKRGVNQLTDKTKGELRALHGLNRPMLYAEKQKQLEARLATGAAVKDAAATMSARKKLPDSLDWRDQNVVTAVKNQGECGSCWTFASTETLESHWAIKHGAHMLQELSEQFVLDCTPNPEQCGGTGGCMGGTGELAYGMIKKNGGIPTEWTYPYVSVMGNASTCHGLPLPPAAAHQGEPSAAANVTGFVNVESNNYQAVMTAIAEKGPMAISVDAGDWHDYESGVFDGGNKTNPELDHLVQLVGYGSETAADTGGARKKSDYWLVRNSWTPLWGEDGYIKLARYGDTKEGEPCGLDINPADGNGCKGGPATVKVCGQNGMLFDAIYPTVG